MYLRQPPRSEGGPLRRYFAARDPPLQAQCGGGNAPTAGERIEHQIPRPGPLTQQRLQNGKWLVIRMIGPAAPLPGVVVPPPDAPHALQIARLQLSKRSPPEY